MQRRTKSTFANRAESEQKRKRKQLIIIAAVLAVILVVAGFLLLRGRGKTTEISAVRLTCQASQNVTPFGDSILYYDDTSIVCLSGNGAIRWTFPIGSGVTFSVGERYIAAWQGMQLYIIDYNGNATYNESLAEEIQFARVGRNYVAVVIGKDTKPDLLVKDMHGSQIDEESDAFSNLMLLDVGFYGNDGEYMWTLSMDVYSTALNTILNTFQVGKMNTGEANVGEKLAYHVLYENNRLRVFTTQQLYSYNYKAVLNSNDTMLVYGWKAIDECVPERGDGNMLLAPTRQTSASGQTITELRVISGQLDRRFALPVACVGAMVVDRSIYAFSPNNYMYRSAIGEQRFHGYSIPIPDGLSVTAYLGDLNNKTVLLACGEIVFSVTLPE